MLPQAGKKQLLGQKIGVSDMDSTKSIPYYNQLFTCCNQKVIKRVFFPNNQSVSHPLKLAKLLPSGHC